MAAQALPRKSPGFVRRLARNPPAVAGVVVICLAVFVAIFAPFVSPYTPTAQHTDDILQAPSGRFLLGTDDLGRDTLTRIIFGARVSLMVGVIAVAIGLVLGSVLGLIAGYLYGLVDSVIMRVMDGLLAFPALVLALAITAMLGPSLVNVMIAIGVTGIPSYARLVRGQVLALRGLDYVVAARSLGQRPTKIVVAHILPNTIAPIIVQTSISIPGAILAEAGLSFLGLGVQPPTPSWGAMINTAQGYMLRDPWVVIAPGVAIFVTVLAFNFLGDALRDALDPRLR
ncbi:MAG TPA: ABC transporter permease [Thermomicrobiaceae bacterium]|nr:ABC transporter permease [Thermomicrobiaceae bacterium]